MGAITITDERESVRGGGETTTVTICDEATREVAVMALWRVVADLCNLDHAGMHDAAWTASCAWEDPEDARAAIEGSFGEVDAVRDAIRQTETTVVGSALPEPNLVRKGLDSVLDLISDYGGEELLRSHKTKRDRIIALYDAGSALQEQLKVEARA